MAFRRGMAAFWATYNVSLAQRPLFTKCVTGVVGTVLGDLIAQLSSHALSSLPTEGGAAIAAEPAHLQSLSSRGGAGGGSGGAATSYTDNTKESYVAGKDKNKGLRNGFKYDVARVLRLCLWSVVVGTPIAHYWFRFLDTRVMPHAPTSNAAVVTKLLLDQLVLSPAGTAFFFFGFRLLEGGSLQDARSSVASKWGPTMALNYVLWPAANIINFKFVPPEQRILYVNCVALFWSAVMSHMANRKDATATAASTGSGSAFKVCSDDAVALQAAKQPLLSARSRSHAAAALAPEPSGYDGQGSAMAAGGHAAVFRK